jgi:dGTPase
MISTMPCGERLLGMKISPRTVRVYEVDKVHRDFIKSSKIVGELYHYFMENEEIFLGEIGKEELYDPLELCVRDFIAGMTDRYAFKLYEKIFLPFPWRIV